jgi:hypothetical protein
MGGVLSLIFQIAGLGLGVYHTWPEAVYLLGAAQEERLSFMRALEAGERILVYFTLVLLPLLYPLRKVLGNKLYSALAVLVFSGLCVILAQILHASIVDGYVFFISLNKNWGSLARPAAVFVIVVGNWLIAFAEMYRVAKVAGK